MLSKTVQRASTFTLISYPDLPRSYGHISSDRVRSGYEITFTHAKMPTSSTSRDSELGRTEVNKVLIRELLFADNAALATHGEAELESLMNRFSHACKQFGLTISLKKTNVMGQDTDDPPSMSIDGHHLEAVESFTRLPELYNLQHPVTGCRAQLSHCQSLSHLG